MSLVLFYVWWGYANKTLAMLSGNHSLKDAEEKHGNLTPQKFKYRIIAGVWKVQAKSVLEVPGPLTQIINVHFLVIKKLEPESWVKLVSGIKKKSKNKYHTYVKLTLHCKFGCTIKL